MTKMSKLEWFLCLLVACNPETAPHERVQPRELPKLEAQRVTATVKREAPRLVHIQTEHEALLTTPEHPFGTPHSGWIPAGQLVRGDRIVSARFGTVRVLSVQNAKPAQPELVFNLTVDPSHAYLVGTDQVLVHNTRCKDPAEREKEIEDAERELQELNQRLPSSAEEKTTLAQQIAQAQSKIKRLKGNLDSARRRQKRAQVAAGLDTAEPARVRARERSLQNAEADYESRRLALEAAQRELSELLSHRPPSDSEKKAQAARRAALEEEIKGLQLEHDASKEILTGERRIAELAGRSPSTDAEREQIAREWQNLSVMLTKKRQDRRNREKVRKRHADPDAREKRRRESLEGKHRRLRSAVYMADTVRPRDTLELLEEELATRRQEGAGSESVNERTEYLTERIATLKEIYELRRKRESLNDKLSRLNLQERTAHNREELKQRTALLEEQRTATRTRLFQLNLRERLLAQLDGTTRTDAPHTMDEARLRELEHELEHELAAGATLPEERLREIQRELGETELIDAEFLEEIWREAEAEETAIQETVQDEAEDVDALLRALVESSGKSPSPERTAAVEASLQALQNELREERRTVEAADVDLAKIHTFVSQTLPKPGSSLHAAGAHYLAELQQQRTQLRIDWRTRMQHRLDEARQELRVMQSMDGLRDPRAVAELERKIALLEYEANGPVF